MIRSEDTQSTRKRDRAQTVQDFAVGIGLFLLAVAFIFAFVPSIITPFADAGSAQTAQADRISASIVDDLSIENPNELNLDDFDTYEGESDELIEELGLRGSDDRAFDRVNITIVTFDEYEKDSPTWVESGGDEYDGQVGASATRIVTTDDGECEPACKLIVRVW